MNELVLHIRWPMYWSFSFSTSPFNEYSRLISFRIGWFDLLAILGTLKSLLQHYNSKVSVLQYSAFFLSLFQLEANYLTILWWFLPFIGMNQPWVYMCSPSWTPLQPPSPSHPSGSSQCTSPEHPVSCIEPGLMIYFTYGNMRVSLLFSQIIPLFAFSHRVQKSVLYICVSFALSHVGSSLPSF